MSDIFQSIDDMPPEAIERIVDRLEFRGQDPEFVRMREQYFEAMNIAACRRVLDLGCGTGVVARALAARSDFKGEIVGVDYSSALIDAANRLGAEEGLLDRVEFRIGDSHTLDDADESFDAIIAHTLVSHAADPASVIKGAARVISPGGIVAIFDGDYASLTYGAGDGDTNNKIVQGVLEAIVANPYIMRQLPGLLQAQGLELTGFFPSILAEGGTASFFSNLAESYIPMAIKSGTISSADGSEWLAAQLTASESGAFFGACNYYAYLAQKPVSN